MALFPETTQVSRYQKGKTNLDFTEARDSEWQRHQLGHMQVCTSLQTDNHTSTPPLFFTGRMPFLPPNQQCQSTEGKVQTTENCTKILIKLSPFRQQPDRTQQTAAVGSCSLRLHGAVSVLSADLQSCPLPQLAASSAG